MSYPTYRQDFEGGSTLGTACPELIDFGSLYSIDSSGAHALTGTRSLKTTNGNAYIYSSANDTLSGNITFTAYFNPSLANGSMVIRTRITPAGVQTSNTWIRCIFNPSGITIQQDVVGTLTTLNTPISGVTIPAGVWLCLELRCNGTAISARIVRQDNGQFFVNTGGGSWSSTPQVQSGTATLTGTGGTGLQLGDTTAIYVDDLYIEPAIPSIDVPSFSLSSAAATQQLTAGGFTDPLNGVTWSSSNTGVATVNSAGLVTAVAAGSATITATGKRDTGQTATSTVTVATTNATGYTVTAPTPPSGYVNNTSGNFVVTPNGTYTGSITITPGASSGLAAFGHNWTASSTPWLFTILPTSAGVISLAPTNSGGLTDAPTLTYGAAAQTLAVGPLAFTASVPATATFTGAGTKWRTFAPTITVTGAAGTTIGAVTVLSDTSASALVSPGATLGTATFTDSTTGATATATVGALVVRSTWNYLGSVEGFSSGLTGSVGYTVLRSDGSTYTARTTAGVFAIGLAGYGALIALPLSGAYVILWDDGSGHAAFEVVNPVGTEPASLAFPGGLNQSQCLSEILAAISGLSSGFVGTGSSNPVFLAPDGLTARITGTVDQLGNRTGLTLTPPL